MYVLLIQILIGRTLSRFLVYLKVVAPSKCLLASKRTTLSICVGQCAIITKEFLDKLILQTLQ